jgi:hypothetical protein
MNEQIQNLKDKIWTEEYWTNPNTDKLLPAQLNRFAELIVFECVNAVMDGTKEGDHYAQRIEQHFDNGAGGVLHFGVEE